jgi:hypothetical protein
MGKISDLRLIISIIILVIIFFIPLVKDGKGFLYGDNLSHIIPTQTFWKEQVQKGKIPLWNPYILGGIPFFADLTHNTLAPTNIFYLIFPVSTTLSILVILYVCLAGIFTYLFAKKISTSKWTGFFSAIIFAFSGTLIAAVNDLNSLQGIAFIPFVFYTAQRWIEENKAKDKFLFILALTLQFISSHPQYTYYTWISVSLYLLVMLEERLRKKIIKISKIFLIVVALSAVQLLPLLEFFLNSYRPKETSFSAQDQLQIIELPRLIIANFYGTWRRGSSWGPGTQLEAGMANTKGYVGVLPLILAIYISVKSKNKEVRFWSILTLGFFLLSLGNQLPFFNTLRTFFPLYSNLRAPIRSLSIYSFGISILAGLALLNLQKKK